MSVIGFDFGNENCFIAVARAGGIETIANEYSQRVTPSYVAFGEKQRELGVSAKNKQNTNIKSTIYGFKRFVGRNLRDPQMDFERCLLPFQLVEMPNGETGVLVRYLNTERQFSSRQITAMLFTKLKEIAESALKIKVTDCVVSVPVFFNDFERRALLDATKIAGLNCLKLMNETTAVALTYGFYRTDLPEDKARLVAFVDMGHSALQVSIVAFNKDKLKMISCEADTVGGRDLDRVLVDYFCEDLGQRFKLDVRSNKRAIIRLYTECEKLKKQMSSIALELPMNIECFMEDKDVSGKMKRDKFEELSEPILKRIESTIALAIANCPPLEDGTQVTALGIDSVEIVGGSSRVPAVKALVKKIFGREPSTTLNADEAVARGCALQCAMLSPTFRVKDFSITDLTPYPIAVRILPKLDPTETSEYDAFPKNHQAPYSRAVSVPRREPFQVEAFYRDSVPFAEKRIGTYNINVVPTNPEANVDDKVKVKVRVNLNGIFTVVSATLYEKADEETVGSNNESQNADENNAQEETAAPEGDLKEPPKKKSPKAKQTDMAITGDPSLAQQSENQILADVEASMVLADRTEQERLDAKNAVEEYVYEMRDKIGESLAQYASDEEKATLSMLLTETEEWLYGEGEELEKKAYIDRLEKLHAIGLPIQERYRESQERPRVLEECGSILQRVRKAIHSFRSGEEKYDHLAEEDINRLQTQLDTKQSWLDETIGKINNTALHLPPSVYVSQIREEAANFDRFANQILNKAKPRPPTPPKVEEPMETDKDEKNVNVDSKGETVADDTPMDVE